jgi:hypothetical protein
VDQLSALEEVVPAGLPFGMLARSLQFESIDDDLARVLAAQSEIERLKAGGRMWTAARSILRAAVLADHRDWPEDRVNREVAVRISHGMVARDAS